jgi:hypothetical protein
MKKEKQKKEEILFQLSIDLQMSSSIHNSIFNMSTGQHPAMTAKR